MATLKGSAYLRGAWRWRPCQGLLGVGAEHGHADATFHVFVLLTGQLVLTIEGESPVEVTQGQVLDVKRGVMHTFKNTGSVIATIVEVFGKAPPKAGGNDDALALAQALADRSHRASIRTDDRVIVR